MITSVLITVNCINVSHAVSDISNIELKQSDL